MTKSTPASLSFKGEASEHTTVKPGFHMIATIAKIAECMFPYARKDRSDRCDHMETRLNMN